MPSGINSQHNQLKRALITVCTNNLGMLNSILKWRACVTINIFSIVLHGNIALIMTE